MNNDLKIFPTNMLKTILIVLFSIVASNSFSQNECDDNIQNAQKLYEDGKYNQAVNILESVLTDCKLEKTDKSEVLKYLAASYYELDELEEAEKYMSMFIKKNHGYSGNVNKDPYAFRQELDNFISWPQFYVGLNGGIPINHVVVEKIYPVLDSATADYDQEFSSKKAFSAMFNAGWNINKYFSVNAGFGVTTQTLSQSIPLYTGLSFDYGESSIQFNIPVFFKFSYPIKSKIVPSVFIGGELIQLYEAEYSYKYIQTGDISTDYEFLLLPHRQKENQRVDIAKDRNVYRTAAIAGVQISYILNRIELNLNFKYRKELDYYNNQNLHYSDPNLFITNNYVLPDFKIESYEITFGISFNLGYKVKSKY